MFGRSILLGLVMALACATADGQSVAPAPLFEGMGTLRAEYSALREVPA